MKRIFVGGYMHSGTTLLKNIIASNPLGFTPPGETKFLEHQKSLPNFKNIESLTKYYLTHIYNGFQTNSQYNYKNEIPQKVKLELAKNPLDINKTRCFNFFICMLDIISNCLGKKYWIEKSPNNILYIDQILSEVESSKVVIIVRSPKDAIASKVYKTSGRISKKYKTYYLFKEKRNSVILDAIVWSKTMKQLIAQENKQKENLLILKYETLVCQPEETIRIISTFLDIPLTYNGYLKNNPHKITQNKISTYTHILSNSEKKVVDFFCRKQMIHFGYKVSQVRLLDKEIISCLFFLPVDFINRMYHRTRFLKYKSLISYVSTIIKKLF